MNRITAAILAFTTVIVAAGSARAASAATEPAFNIMGPSDCGRWPKRGAIESAAKAVPLNWILGFASGEAERSDPRLFGLLDPDAVGAWMDAYCLRNPSATLPVASRALISELKGKLPPLEPPAPPMFVPPAAAEEAQKPPQLRPSQRPAPSKGSTRTAPRRPSNRR